MYDTTVLVPVFFEAFPHDDVRLVGVDTDVLGNAFAEI